MKAVNRKIPKQEHKQEFMQEYIYYVYIRVDKPIQACGSIARGSRKGFANRRVVIPFLFDFFFTPMASRAFFANDFILID